MMRARTAKLAARGSRSHIPQFGFKSYRGFWQGRIVRDLILQLHVYDLRLGRGDEFMMHYHACVKRVFERHEFEIIYHTERVAAEDYNPHVHWLLAWHDAQKAKIAWSGLNADEEWIGLRCAVETGDVVRRVRNRTFVRGPNKTKKGKAT